MHVRTSVKRWGRPPYRAIGMAGGDTVFVPVIMPSGLTRERGLIAPVRQPQTRIRRRTTPSSGRE